MSDHTKLNFVQNIHEKNSISLLEDNLKHFLDWSFLQIDGYVNINVSPNTPSEMYTLKPQISPTGSSVPASSKDWEGPVKDWIYENTSSFDPPKNINHISGIIVNNTFLPAPTGSGNYGYYINYPLGKIVFNNPINNNSTIKLNYAYRYVQIYKSNDAAWWKELSKETYNSNSNSYSNILSNHKVQTPFIMIEMIARNNQEAYELGNAKNMITQDILLHIFTENTTQRATLSDTLLTQKDKTIILYDVNKVVKNNKNPLNYRGEINPSGVTYSELVEDSQYQNKISYIKSADLVEMNNFSTSLYNSVIRWSLKIFP